MLKNEVALILPDIETGAIIERDPGDLSLIRTAFLPDVGTGTVAGEARPATVLPAPVRLLLWGVGFLLALWLCMRWGEGMSVHNDFTQNVWLPARLALHGVDPYNPTRAQVDAELGGYASAFDGFNGGKDYFFIYPMWLALAFAPFAAFPLTLALALWRAANLLLLVWGITRLLKVCNPVFRSRRFAAVAAIGVTVLLGVIYRESILTLYVGQFSILAFAILVGIWGYLISSGSFASSGSLPGNKRVSVERWGVGAGTGACPRVSRESAPQQGRHGGLPLHPISLHLHKRLWGDALVGVGLAVLATKPQSVGLPVLLLVLWALSRRRWVIPVAAAASLFALLVAPLLFYPSSLEGFVHSLFGRGQASSQAQVSASVWGVSYQWLHGFMPWAPVAAALTLIGLAALIPSWRRDLTERTSPVPLALPLTICMNSVISPYMLGYEHVLLLIPALIFLAAAGLPDTQKDATSRRWRMAIYAWMAVLPFLIVTIQVFVDKEYPVILQSATMLVLWLIADFGFWILDFGFPKKLRVSALN